MNRRRAILVGGLLTALTAAAQVASSTNGTAGPADGSHHPAGPAEYWRASEAMRAKCIQGRRMLCGRIMQVLPGGLVVESGYPSLMRHPLDRSWLIPGTVTAKREPNLMEKNEPDCVCVGLVYLTDPPKLRHGKPKVLDYIVLPGFPTGQFTYNPVGNLQRTVRRFSGSLPAAVQSNLATGALSDHR